MNLLELFHEELKDKHWTDFEKIRYLYLRTCELFSYDSRYRLAHLFDDEKLYMDILGRKIDLCNIDDFLVVCHSYSKEILIKLIREFTNADVKIQNGQHSYVLYTDNSNVTWNLDATLGDLSRVKLNVSTSGFTSSMDYFEEKINDVDSFLGYIHKTRYDYLKLLDISCDKSIFESINLILSESKCNKEYEDAKFLVRWLLFGINYSYSSALFTNSEYDMHHIFIPKENDILWYLSKQKDCYTIDFVSKSDLDVKTRKLTPFVR